MKSINLLLLFLIVFQSSFSQLEKINFRNEIDVLNYTINLKIVNLSKKEISGNTIVKLTPNNKDIKEIKLELLKLTADSVFLFNEKVENYTYNGEIITIPFKQDDADKCCTQVTIYYHGKPIQDASWGGFFFSDTTAYNIGVGMASKPNSYGRVWFPCIDSFEEKASFDYIITVDAGYKAVCSGKLESETKNTDGTVTYFWKMTKEVPPYVVSVAVAKYDIVESIYKGIKREIPISLYVFPEDVANAKVSFQNLPIAMKTYEHSYGEYVWDRVGFVEVPFMSGAMEHVCNIAYPEYAIDSTLYRETLMAHELSHHWFGNLVTCKTSGDMWLNEGWASFSEALFKESVYGKEAYKDYVRENHVKVLTMAHVYDNGYRALYGVPHEYTYGTTVYDKGADVVHTLRSYLGDSIFFSSITAYINKFAYKAASTYDLRDFLSEFSGVDMTNFFETWVFSEGFPHFSIQKFSTEQIDDNFKTVITVRQKLKERDYYGIDNFIDLTFIDSYFNIHTGRFKISGIEENYDFVFPSKFLNVFIDLEEKIADATVDNYKIFENIDSYDFPYTDFSIKITTLTGKALIQSIMNHLKPDNSESNLFEFSKEKYWEIRGAVQDKISSEGTFFVNMTENKFDADFDDLKLFYRADNYAEFKEVKFKALKNNNDEGLLIVKDLKFGQYVAGIKK